MTKLVDPLVAFAEQLLILGRWWSYQSSDYSTPSVITGSINHCGGEQDMAYRRNWLKRDNNSIVSGVENKGGSGRRIDAVDSESMQKTAVVVESM